MSVEDTSDPRLITPVDEGQFLRFLPEEAQTHWRYLHVGAKMPSYVFPLLEARILMNASGGAATGLELALLVSPEAYQELEIWGYFDLTEMPSSRFGVEFSASEPIRLEVALLSDWLEGVFTRPLDPLDPEGTLLHVLRPLLDPSSEGSVHVPSAYEWRRVVQGEGPALKGFTRAGRLQDVDAPELPEVEESFEARAVYSMEPFMPTSLVLSDGPVLEPVLERLRLLVDVAGNRRLEASFQFASEDYLALDYHQGMDLRWETRGPNAMEVFEEGAPIFVDAVLREEVLRNTASEEDTAEELLTRIASLLGDSEQDSPLRECASWIYRNVLQQPEGQSFKAGFENLEHP